MSNAFFIVPPSLTFARRNGEVNVATINEKPTRWDALKEIFLTTEKRKTIGPAWPLYVHLIFRGDPTNRLVTSNINISEDLGEKVATVKKWKERLTTSGIIQTKRTRHGVILSILPPYDSPVTAMKDDVVEMRLKSDPKTRNLLKMALASDSMALLPVIADLARKVEVLENRGNG